MSEGQKAQDVLEQIKGIKNKADLQAVVEANLALLIESSPEIRSAVDHKWKEVTGQYLFMPITSTPQPQSHGPMHPKLTKYHVTKRIVGVDFDRIKETRKYGSQIVPVEYFHLVGVIPDGTKQEIDPKLDKEQLPNVLSPEVAKKIISITGPRGFVKCNEEVSMIGYWEVMFSSKSAPNDTDDVFLSYQGVCLQIKRNIPVVLPGYYLEVSDNGIYPKYVQTPAQSRKITAWVQFYPYTALREATESEYLAAKLKGDTVERDERRRREVIS